MAINFYNFDTYFIIKVFLILYNIYSLSIDENKVVFYVNNCIN